MLSRPFWVADVCGCGRVCRGAVQYVCLGHSSGRNSYGGGALAPSPATLRDGGTTAHARASSREQACHGHDRSCHRHAHVDI